MFAMDAAPLAPDVSFADARARLIDVIDEATGEFRMDGAAPRLRELDRQARGDALDAPPRVLRCDAASAPIVLAWPPGWNRQRVDAMFLAAGEPDAEIRARSDAYQVGRIGWLIVPTTGELRAGPGDGYRRHDAATRAADEQKQTESREDAELAVPTAVELAHATASARSRRFATDSARVAWITTEAQRAADRRVAHAARMAERSDAHVEAPAAAPEYEHDAARHRDDWRKPLPSQLAHRRERKAGR
jgi:hypothetical protein